MYCCGNPPSAWCDPAERSRGNSPRNATLEETMFRIACGRLLSYLLCLSWATLAQEPKPAVDAGETIGNSFQSSFFHFRYELPNGWSALPDDVRIEENRKRYETQLAEALKKEGPNRETQKTEVFPPYNLPVAAPTLLTSSETSQIPRLVIYAQKRITMLMEAGDPAKMVSYIPQVKVLRGPEDLSLSGHKFVRTDFRFQDGELLSKFVTVDGNYLVNFDFRPANEKGLLDLASTMQTVAFKP
jgi:hypothetical protein